jgi:hypothetical protein
MPPLTKDDLNAIHETHDTIIELKTVLLGTNGDAGLCGDVKKQGEKLERTHTTLWILIGILAGSGVLTAGIYAIFQMVQ